MAGSICGVILAAGQGSRMKSQKTKILTPVAGLPMVGHVLKALCGLVHKTVAVIAPQAPDVQDFLHSTPTVIQPRALGTGDALKQAKEEFSSFEKVLVVLGDTPLITSATLEKLIHACDENSGCSGALLGFHAPCPTGYGRLLLNDKNQLVGIVEEKQANEEQKKITLCHSGIMCFHTHDLLNHLDSLSCHENVGEYYLTDMVDILFQAHRPMVMVQADFKETIGVNEQSDLATVQGHMQNRLRQKAMDLGVSFMAPETVFLAHDTSFESGVCIDPYVFFDQGVHVGEQTHIHSFSHLSGCKVGSHCQIGPYARLRPGVNMAENVRVGNFVEMKNTHIEKGSKINHLSYLGDAFLQEDVNVGAGTITCNYDGVSKHQTHVGKGAFIGSHSALVAPVNIGNHAIVGAGTTVRKDVLDDQLVVDRPRVIEKKNAAKHIQEKKIRRHQLSQKDVC